LFNAFMVRCGFRYLASLGEIVMRVKIDVSALGQTRWHDYAIRFVFGGLITAGAGIIAKEFGPGIGGLFLAFPAIFPASATLIEKHEKQKKEKHGVEGTTRGTEAAGIDAAGAAMGSIGLLAFAFVVWRFVTNHNPWLALAAATLVWLTVSVLVWEIRKAA
jgi:Protein of unknown function (DUF3147)